MNFKGCLKTLQAAFFPLAEVCCFTINRNIYVSAASSKVKLPFQAAVYLQTQCSTVIGETILALPAVFAKNDEAKSAQQPQHDATPNRSFKSVSDNAPAATVS